MPKKIIKLIQTSALKFCKQTIFMFDRGNKDIKYRVPEFKGSKRSSDARNKRKRTPTETLLAVSRYLTASIDFGFRRYSKISLFCKNLLSHIYPEERAVKTTFAALNNANNNTVVPKQSRGLNNETRTTADPTEDQPKKKNQILKRNIEQKILGAPHLGSIKELNGIEEQRFYTEEPSAGENPFLNLKRTWNTAEETPSIELPPPRRCRLSCPLPPPELRSSEKGESPSDQEPSKFRLLERRVSEPEKRSSIQNHKKTNETVTTFSEASFNNLQPETTMEGSKNDVGVPPPNPSLTQDIPKMKALLFDPTTLKLKYDEVNAPIKIFKDEVLVQVAYSGVCGTDLFITEGKVSCGDSPIILGHEISGKVYAIGKEVDHVVPGDKVAVNAYTACSVCRYCSRGLFSGCLNEGLNNSIGISKNGGWAEFIVVKKSQVHKIPEQLRLDQAALIQPLSCVLSAMSKLKILHEMDILIQGLGLTGCLWASVLHSQGYKNVVVCEKILKRRKEFESLGTNYLIIPPEDVGRYSADLVVECTGSPYSIERSLNVLNPNGQMCFFGKPHPVTEVRCIPYEIIRKEITIVGNTGNAFHFSKAIDVASNIGQRYLDFDKLGVKTYDLKNFKEAFGQKKTEEVRKIIFKLFS